MSFIQQFFTSRDNNANAETFVGQQGRLWWDPVTNQIYSSDGETPGGIPLAGGGGGNGTPGGSNSQVQFNNNGAFGGTANVTINSATGALTAVSFAGDGSTLTNITGANVVGEVAYAAIANSVAGANVTGAVANATYADTAGSATSATTAVTVTANAQPNITSVGTLNSVSVLGNVDAGGLYVGGSGVVTGNLQIQGNLTYNNLTNITTANLVFGLANTSVGVSANGAGWVVGNTNQASWLYNFGTQLWNSNIGISAIGNIIGSNITTGGLISAAGNVSGGNLRTTGVVSATGGIISNGEIYSATAVTGGNVSGATVFATGNVTGGNILTNGLISATGNISGGNVNLTSGRFSGGSLSVLGSVTGGGLSTAGNLGVSGNAAVGNLSATGSINLAGRISAVGNITGGNLLTGANVSATGNVTGGNVISNGLITTVSNVVANYFVGNGAALYSITGANVVGAVTDAIYASSAVNAINAETVTANSQPNITGVGILSSLSVSGNVDAAYFIGNGSQLTGISSSSNRIFNGTSNVEIATADSNVTITTAGTSTWTFDTAGNLNLPGGNIVQAVDRDLNIVVQDADNDDFAFQTIVDDGAGTTLSRIRQRRGDIQLGTGLATGSPHYWQFDSGGTLRLPGNVWGNAAGNLTVLVPISGADSFISLQTRDNTDTLKSNINVTTTNVTISTNTAGNTWVFDNAGVLTAPGSVEIGTGGEGVQLRSNPTGTGFYTTITNITNGLSTVVVTLNDIEFIGGDQGTVTITGVVGETEANGFWGWEAVSPSAIQLYTDGTLSTPVDGTTWSAYVSGGLAVSSGYNDLDLKGGSVAIISGSGQYWAFNPNGNLTLPSNTSSINYANGAPYGGGGASLPLANGTSNFNIATVNGNATVTTNSANTWTFDTTGTLTVPTIATGDGTSEVSAVTGARKIIGSVGTWSTFIDGHSAFGALAWTASSSAIQSAKITFVVQSNGTAYNWEQFDVAICRLDGANAYVSVSGRVKQNSAIDYTDVSGYVSGGSLQVWLNPADGQTSAYVNYNSVEFNIMPD